MGWLNPWVGWNPWVGSTHGLGWVALGWIGLGLIVFTFSWVGLGPIVGSKTDARYDGSANITQQPISDL